MTGRGAPSRLRALGCALVTALVGTSLTAVATVTTLAVTAAPAHADAGVLVARAGWGNWSSSGSTDCNQDQAGLPSALELRVSNLAYSTGETVRVTMTIGSEPGGESFSKVNDNGSTTWSHSGDLSVQFGWSGANRPGLTTDSIIGFGGSSGIVGVKSGTAVRFNSTRGQGHPEINGNLLPGDEMWIDYRAPDSNPTGIQDTFSGIAQTSVKYTAPGVFERHSLNTCRVAGSDLNPACTVSQSGPGGSVLDFGSTVQAVGGGYQQEWTFSDGTTSSASSVVRTATEPGEFSGTFRVWRPGTSTDKSVTCEATVEPPGLGVTITPVDETGTPLPEDHELQVGDMLRLRERISADDDGIGALTAITPADGVWLDPNDALTPVEEPTDLPETLTLDPGESQDWFWTYEIVQAGAVGATVSLDATDAVGAPIDTVDGSWVDSVSGLQVELGTAWPGSNDPDDPPEFQKDNNGDGVVDDRDHVLTVKIKITNLLEDTVRDVEPRVDDRPVDFRNLRVGAAVAMEELPDEDYSMQFGNLGASGTETASKELTVTYLATGDVHAYADAFFHGVPDAGGLAKGYGKKEIRFGSHLALKAELRVEDRPYISGAPVRVLGSLTNLLQDRLRTDGTTEEAPDLAVVLIPVTAENAAGGYAFPADYGGATPIGIDPLVVEPGETLDIKAILATQSREQATAAEVRYTVRAWAKDPDQPDGVAHEIDITRIDVVDDDTYSPEQHVALALNPVLPDGSETCGSSSTYTQIFSCNLVTGLANLATSIKDLAFMVPGGLSTIADAKHRLLLWELQTMGNTFSALAGNEVARQKLIQEIQVQMETWVNVGIMSRDALTAVGGGIAEFIREGDRVYSTGDYEAMTAFAGRFLGENPDLGLAALGKIRAMRAMAAATVIETTAKDAAIVAVREANQAAGKKAAEELLPKVKHEIANGRNPVESGILKGGEDLTDIPEVLSGVDGARDVDVQRVLDIAEDENVLIGFRGRAPISQSLLDRALAYVKPMDVKTKNVNAIDKYLGYPDGTYGRVALIDPPIDWRPAYEAKLERLSSFERAAAQAKFDKSLDDYMVKLGDKYPEIKADSVWAAEVRGRLKQRVEEFPKEIKNFKRYRDHGIVLEFGYAEQGLPKSMDVGGRSLRKAQVGTTQTVDAFGETRTVYHLKMADANGQNFKWITGDIDFVTILNPDRTPLTDPIKRKRVYDKLQQMVGMMHGETGSYVNADVQAKLLRDHTVKNGSTQGVEAIMVAAPDRRVRAGFLEERLSSTEEVAAGSPASSFSLISGGPTELVSDLAAGPPGRTITPWDVVYDRLDKATTYLLPAKWNEFVDGLTQDQVAEEFNRETGTIRPDGKGGLEFYVPPTTKAPREVTPATSRPVAPRDRASGDPFENTLADLVAEGVDLDPVSGPGAAGGRWVPVTLAAALAKGRPGELDVVPIVSMTKPVAIGARTLTTATAAQLGLRPGTPWFRAGDRVALDPGGTQEEYATVASANATTGAMTLTRGVIRAHDSGQTLLLLPVAKPAYNACTAPRVAAPGAKKSKLAAALVSKKVAKGKRGTVVASATYKSKKGWTKTAGPVLVCSGTKLLASTNVKAGKPKRVRLPALPVGKHRITVFFLGNKLAKPASKVVVLKVVRS